MQNFLERLSAAAEDDFAAYREVIDYCESRITGEEGIPAIIGLDDLTGSGNTVFRGAPMDEQMHLSMAADALIFNMLYSQQEERDMHYPSIAPAMSALAEKQFCIPQGETEPVQYRTMRTER